VRCIDRRGAAAGAAILLGLLAGCSRPPPTPAAVPVPSLAPPEVAPALSIVSKAEAVRPVTSAVQMRTLQELRLRVAQRLVAANPEGTYTEPAPDPLLAIPVLRVELDIDGNVRRIEVLRQPRQARDTTRLAIDAVRRAAPFGDLSHVPRPWTITETFLFDDERRFKPRTLEQ